MRGDDLEARGCRNLDVQLLDEVTPVHEYLPSAGSDQKAVSSMGFDER